MPALTEDEIYRSSSQFRLWSFTKQALLSLRGSTNDSAAGAVRNAIESSHTQNGTDPLPEVDCLSVEEEQRIVGFYCVKAMQFADFCEFPTNVKASWSSSDEFLVLVANDTPRLQLSNS